MLKTFSIFFAFGFMSLQVLSQGVIVNSNPTMNDRFGKRVGSMRLSTVLFKVGKIKNNASKTDTVHIYNDGTRDLTLALGKIPEHLSVNIGTAVLAPKKESWIAITYNAEKKKDYGFGLDKFEVLTNDTIQPKKSISVSAHIQEYFSPLTAQDSLEIQKAKWSETVYDFGKIKQGTKVTHTFTVTNEGKRDLYIRKTKSNCSCIKLTASSDTLSPGSTAILSAEYDSSGKQGKDSRRINVFLNDPARSEVVLEMKGEIEK